MATSASQDDSVSDFPKPYPVQSQGSRLAARLLQWAGWTVSFEGLPSLQGVLVVYPHTSNWDFIVLVLAKWSVGLQVSFWAKDSLFGIPLFGRWLRWVGGIPVKRHAAQGVVGQAVEVIRSKRAKNEYFWLGLSPEGTRRLTPGWRSGFYQTALRAGGALGVFKVDFARKVVDARSFIALTGDVQKDFERLRMILKGVQGCRPENASPIQLIER